MHPVLSYQLARGRRLDMLARAQRGAWRTHQHGQLVGPAGIYIQ
jgi:hypothetical protein